MMAKASRSPASRPARASATRRRPPWRCARRRCSRTADGVLDTGDIEGVHDMRVATRRLRAAHGGVRALLPAEGAQDGC